LDYKAQINEENSPKEYCTWQDLEILVEKLAHTIQRSGKKYDVILAITNGGIVPVSQLQTEAFHLG
jgi:hypoxanthine phosphoribosyltransferase